MLRHHFYKKLREMNFFVVICSLALLQSCSDGSGSGSNKSFDFLDPIDDGQGVTACAISSTSPSTSTTRIANTGSTPTQFLVVSSGTNCEFKYKLNGVEKATTANYSLLPTDTDLGPGVNTLVVEVSNSKGSATKTWTITRNTLPACGSGSPAYAAPVAVSIGSPQSFQVIGASDTDGDPLTFSWTLDGTSVAALVTDISSSNFSQATFSSTGAHIGSRTVSAVLSDGYDTQLCSWTANVAGSCAITSTTPSSTSFKVAALGTTSTSLSLTTATSGCIVNWTINGAPIVGTTAGQSILSSSLVTGVNSVTATTASGATTTWFVQKNSAPTCAQLPSPSPTVTTGVGNPLALTSNISDADDPTGSMTYDWKVNGATVSGAILSNLNGIYTSVGTFTPTVAEVGTANVTSTVNDGFDSTTCTWPVRVINACSIISYFPSSSTQKIAYVSGSNQSFLVTPNDATVCSVAWTINGTSVGTSSNIYSLVTEEPTLNAAGVANTLRATITNGYGSTVTRDWVVTRNSAPSCNTASQLPATTPVEFFYTGTQNFSSNINNTDADPMTYTWKLNGGNTSLFGSISSNTTSSVSTLSPTSGQIGDGQTVAMEFTDTYDSNQCTWTTNIRDASTVAITSCSPSVSPDTIPSALSRVDITATGVTSSRDFIVLATGVDLTYTWERDGSGIAGYVNSASASFTADQSNWPSNTHTLKVRVKDRYNNEKFCQWNVKKNDRPTLSSPTPTTTESVTATYKYNYKRRVSTPISEYGVALQISALDLNSDDASTLKFQWFKDGVRQYDSLDPEITTCVSSCPSVSDILKGAVDLAPTYDSYNSGTTTWTSVRVYNPYAYFDDTLLGETTITARVIDNSGDYRDISWKIQANQFTDACNTLYNGPVDSGKKICTLVGSPSIGQGADWVTNPLQFRIYPRDVKRDSDGLWIADGLSHVVMFFNDTVVPVTRVGYTIPGKTFQVVAGNGADGRNQDNPVAKQEFKFNLPIQTAYDSTTDALFVSDYSNNRVVLINSAGLVTSFVGNNPSSTPANNLAGNTAGNLGTSHVCTSPVGLKIQSESGTRYLYVACSGSHSIKKVNIQTPGTGSYGQTTIFVGRLSSTNTTVAGAYDGTVGPTGTAEVDTPWSIDNDSNGNIYWTEAGSLSHRIRYYNASLSTQQFFPNSTPQPYAHSFYVSDTSNQVTTPGTIGNVASFNPSLNTSGDRITIKGPSRVLKGNCYPVKVQLNDSSSRLATNSSGTTNYTMSTTNVGLYTTSGCTIADSATFSLTSVQYERLYWIKSTTAGTFTLSVTESSATFTVPNRTASLSAITVDNAISSTATTVNLLVPSNQFAWTDCQPVMIQFRNGTAISTLNRTGVTLRLGTNGVGNFYSTDTCTAGTVINTVAPITTDSEIWVYYKRTSYALTNRVQSLLGTVATNITVATMYDAGSMGFNNPRGLAVKETAGTVEGFIVSAHSNNMMYFINTLSTLQNFGGQAFSGSNHMGGALTNNGASWLSDASPLLTNRVYNPEGVDFDNATQKMWIADLSNYRVRYVDTSSGSNPLTTYLGSGRSRNGFVSENEAASDAYLFNPNGIYYEAASKKLFIADSNNVRIRQLDILRGTVETYVGRSGGSGLGQSYTPGTTGDPRASVYMRPPQHVYAHNSGGKNFLMWMEQHTNLGTLRTCGLKVLNRSTTTATLFGFTVAPDAIINVLGNYALGCGLYSGDNANAQLAQINNYVGFATDGDVIYVAATADHCILKVDNTGAVSKIVGTCGTAGAATNTTGASAFLRYPTHILIDPLNPTNFFFLDQADQAGSPVRYVNTTNSTIVFGDPGGTAVYAAANGGSGSTVTTIWSANTAGGQAGRLYGLAAFGNRICWSAGGTSYGVGINGNAASHVVSCADRTDTNMTVDRIVGPSDASVLTNKIRGGAPLGTEQEGINGQTARLNGPWGITFDSDGNLYIADRTNGVIRMVRRWF
jgi:hypothetical protein